MRLAVVGFGYWGPNLVRNLRELEGADLAAVCDLRAEALDTVDRRYPGVFATAELEEILGDETIDGVVIATPVSTHYEIAEAALARDIWIVVDLCYEKLIYDPAPHNLPAVLARKNRDLTVLCGSSSKAYAMTGWRCGWVVGPAALVGACNAIQSHSTSNACSIPPTPCGLPESSATSR